MMSMTSTTPFGDISPFEEFSLGRRQLKTKSDGSTALASKHALEDSSVDTSTPHVRQVNMIANWHRFVDSLVKQGAVTTTHAEAVRQLWRSLALSFNLTAPSCILTEEGALQLSWNGSGEHVELDVFPDAAFEWLWVNTTTQAYEGSDERETELPKKLLAAFSRIFV